MLFYLTDSLIVDKSHPQFSAIRRAVKYIAMSVFESKHLLRGDYQVLKYMEEEFRGDKESYPIFHRLVSKYSTYTVPDDICRYVEVVLSGFAEYEKDGHRIKQIEYGYFNDSKKVQEMIVMAEDLEDCYVFEYALKWYIKQNHLSYNYCFTPRGGGGSRIELAVKNCLKSGEMVTCITDSDQRYPGMPLKSDSNCMECKRLGKNTKDKIYYFLMMPVLELENLIPLNHLDRLDLRFEINRKDKEAFDKLCNNAYSEQILPHFDIKEGLKKEHLNQYGKDFADYAAMCCACNPELMGGKSFEEYVDSLDDKDVICPRLNKRPMKDLAPLYINGDALDEPQLMPFQLQAWEEIGALLLDTTCARNKESIAV
jgi:hypothetical protein